jgi:hypothetical protein
LWKLPTSQAICIVARRQVIQAAMWPEIVVILSPLFNLLTSALGRPTGRGREGRLGIPRGGRVTLSEIGFSSKDRPPIRCIAP